MSKGLQALFIIAAAISACVLAFSTALYLFIVYMIYIIADALERVVMVM